MKKISFACDDNSGLQAQLSGHFGRCPYYTLVDVEGSEIKGVNVIENPYFNNHVPGQVPQFIKDQNANVMIAGGMGPRAIDLFSGFGIEVATGISGQVSDILTAYLSGKVSGTVACGHDHEESCGEGH
jgi:predicted Fe-Mo cluster-binding NifX family protein